jgi:hypothetical protein
LRSLLGEKKPPLQPWALEKRRGGTGQLLEIQLPSTPDTKRESSTLLRSKRQEEDPLQR